ncbi:FKBP-type peptidyl-prolyl cis-trans isomerase [Dinghuibacter silviterrae]|uniref:Peptidyl-prolyl cis-trans isomerase n=1 Tax=Dinghuibacter silviterrae TaxID=1539049 RepID=A0A4R8DSS0_9BACT|nr:FKBP-type peptidyl-prolyl cis-trans isomerase [Dinghuibacter silviterrae]TDX01119.1 FKBP-type peptidyl-prolyl cis-trans isomerase FkpA/FKBP-type peptidyl-prolyl cis-trans isomerase FklB [Dinghuibacter silviterrae]
MHKMFFSVALLTLGTGAFAQTKKPVAAKKAVAPAPLLKNSTDSLSYAIGVNVGTYFKKQGVEHLNYAALDKALADCFGEKPLTLSDEQAVMTIQQKLQEFMTKKANAVKEEGLKFLAENKKRPGVVELPDGLQYEVIRKGTGPMPVDTSVVKVNYTGYLLSGKKFDASADHGGPATFPLNRVIKGWTEGVKLMPVGSSYKFYIPSELAYGDRGAGNDIPGGSTLIFEVELLDIVAPGATPAPAAGQ